LSPSRKVAKFKAGKISRVSSKKRVKNKQTILYLCFPKRLSKALEPNINKLFANRILKLCPELCYSVDEYSTRCNLEPFSCPDRKKILQKKLCNYNSNLMEEIYMFRSELQDGSLKLFFPFLNYIFGIWE
jgi:hypothetical protein